MPGGEKTYKVNGEVYTIPDSDAGSFLKDFPKAMEIKTFAAGKDTFDIPVDEVPNFLKEVKDAKEVGVPEPAKPTKPLPSIDQQMPDMGIHPVGTFTKEKPIAFEEQLKKGGQVEHGVLTVHDTTVPRTNKPDIGEAIDNLLAQKNKGFSASKESVKIQRNAIEKAYKNGDLALTKDATGKSVLKKGTGFLSSAIDAINNAAIENIHNNILAGLDNQGKRDYLAVKDVLDQKYKSNTVPAGAAGKVGEFIGENADILAKGAVGAMTAGTLAPGMIGASNFGSFVAMADQFAKGGYSGEMQKTYHSLVARGVPEEQAMDQAHKAGLLGEATGIATGAVLSGIPKTGLQTAPAAAKGFMKAISKSAGKVMDFEMSKMGAVSGAQTFINDLGEMGVGVKKKPGEILNEVGESAAHGAVIGAAFYTMMHPGKVLSFFRPQAENVIASMSPEQRLAYIKTAEQNEVIPKGSAEIIEQKVQEFTKAKEPVNNLPIPEENKAAIAGKILQKQKLQEELQTLTKHGEAFAPRIEELTNEIAGIEKEMAGMYKAKDVFEKEQDSLTGEKIEGEQPKIEADAISEQSSAALGENQGGNEEIGGKESSGGMAAGNPEEPAGARSGQEEANVEGSNIEPVPQKEIVPVKEFVSKQGHTLKNDGGVITVTNKAGKEVSRGTRKKVIREAAESYDFTAGSEAREPEQPIANEGEYKRHVIENSTHPAELATLYINELPEQTGLSSKEQMIADYGMGKVTEDSYRNYGDKNNQNHNKARAYFSTKGTPIDSLAKEIGDHYGVEITPEDVTNFIDRFPNGADAATAMRESDAALSAKDRFSELTGLPLDKEIAEIAVRQQFAKLEKEVQDIAKQDYDSREQLEAEYWKHFSETDGGAENGNGTETGSTEAVDPAKPISNRAKAEEIAKKLLSLRSDGNNLYGGIFGLTVAIRDGMLSMAANVIRSGGSLLDAVDAAMNYVRSNAPRADLEKVKEYLHSEFGIPYTKPTATPNALMQGKDIVDTGVRLHTLDEARDRIEQGIKEKKLSLWDKFAKKAFEGQQEILNKLKSFGHKGKIVADYLITSKGATAKADAFFDSAKEAIYGGIDGFKKVMISGKPMRVQALLNKVVTLRRVIDIDQKMSDKYDQFTKLKKEIEQLTAIDPKDPKIIQLTREYENVKEYLDYNDMLVYDKATGNYTLGQYRHPLGYTSDFAKNDLANIETEHPELFRKLDDRATLLSKTFHRLIDLKEEAGILTKESADALRQYYYAPRTDIEGFINAETDNTAQGGKSKKDVVGIKRLQGGSEEIIEDSYDVQLHKAVMNTMKDIALNNSGQKLLEAVREKNDSDFFYENTPQIYQVGQNKGNLIRNKFGDIVYDEIPKGKAAIKVWQDGKVVEIIGDQRLVDSWYDKREKSRFVSALGKITGAQVLRGAITGYNPGFGIFQLLVDPQSAVISSGLYKSYILGIGTVYKDMIKVSGDVFNPKGVSGVAAEARDYGAFTSFSRGEDVLNLRSDVDVNKRKALRALRATAEAFNWINDRAENLTRTALYSRSKGLQIEAFKKANGKDPVGRDLEEIKTVAARDARKYVDFARGGDYAKEANNFLPYLNAAIQLKRSVLNAAAANPVRMTTMTAEAVAAGVGVMAYSLGLGWASHGLSDEEKKKRIEAYRNVNQVTRAKYFLFYKGEDKDGKPQFWRIEKPMLLNVAINAAEKAMVKHFYPDTDLNAQTFVQDMEDQSPIDKTIVSRNPSLNAILKYYGNKDWYFNKDVVPNAENVTDYLEGTDNKKTKDFYIWLGKKAKDAGTEGGISPLRTQAAVESYIGDPTQNPIVNLLTSTMAIGFDAALGNKQALDERLKSFGEISNYLNFTTMPKRLIAQPSDISVEELKEWKDRGQIKGDQRVIKKAAALGRTP